MKFPFPESKVFILYDPGGLGENVWSSIKRRDCMTGMTINQTWLSLDKKQGYGMTNPDPKCPVMRRRPSAVTFGPQSQRSARGVQTIAVCQYFLRTSHYFVSSVKHSTYFVSFLDNNVCTGLYRAELNWIGAQDRRPRETCSASGTNLR